MKIYFHMDEGITNAMTWEEYEGLELAMEGNIKLYRIRPVLARFMVGEDGKPLSHDDAMKALGQVALSDLQTVIQKFVDGLRETTVPKVNGNSSEPRSEASTEG